MKRNTMLIVDDEEVNRVMMLIRQYRHSMEGVLLDLVMPVKDDCEVRAFDLGASDIILKPFEPHVVRRRGQNVVELNRLKPHLEQASKLWK